MDEKPKPLYTVKCDRCTVAVQVLEKPKMQGFLCNPCWLQWKDLEQKLIGDPKKKIMKFQYEVDQAFINFVNTRPWSK